MRDYSPAWKGLLLLGLIGLPASAQAPRVHMPVGADRASDVQAETARATAIIAAGDVAVRLGGLSESFDDVAALPAAGWSIQNNSDPVGTASWFQGNPTVFTAYEGEGYIGVNFNSTAGTGVIWNWLLTPEVTLENGTELRFWTRTGAGSIYPDRLQVHLSTSGASTDVGAGVGELGDFEELLLEINPDLAVGGYPEAWTEQIVTVSGLSAPTTGRFGFLYFVTDAGPTGDNSNYIGIDEVTVSGKTSSTEAVPGSSLASLAAGVPNPFSHATTLTYTLTQPASVSIEIIDALGRTVASLVNGATASGTHTTTWDASAATPGVYVVRLATGASVLTQRIVLTR